MRNKPQELHTQSSLHCRQHQDQPQRAPAPIPAGKVAPLQTLVPIQALSDKMSHNQTQLPPGTGPCHILSIVPHNCRGSWDVFLSLFNLFASAKNALSIFCLQHPPGWRNCLSSLAGFASLAPMIPHSRPKVAFYVFVSLIDMASVTPIYTVGFNQAILQISSAPWFGTGAEKLQIVNLYRVCNSLTVESSWSVFPEHRPCPTPHAPPLQKGTLISITLLQIPSGTRALPNSRLLSCTPRGPQI